MNYPENSIELKDQSLEALQASTVKLTNIMLRLSIGFAGLSIVGLITLLS